MARKLKEAPEQTPLTEQLLDSNTTINIESAVVEASPYSRCGGAIRIAREKQGLSVQEIASRLRLSPKQIEAIEADNFAALPEPTIVRGFIRNYAKQLKIDVAPILAGYSVIVPSITPHELVVKPSSNMTVSGYEKSNTGRYIWAALALLLALAAWLFYQHYVEKPSPTKPSASSENASQVEALPDSAVVPVELPQPALPAAERQDATTDSSVPVTLPAASDASTIAAPSATVAQVTAPVATAPAIAPPSTIPSTTTPSLQTSNSLAMPADTTTNVPAAAPSNGKKHLEINATQETWVNVTDVNGREIYSKIVFAGSRETIEAKPPFNVVVGNASGTTLAVDGKPMDLAPHTRVNVAHIKIEH